MNVRSIMTDQVLTVHSHTSVIEIREIFNIHHFHHIPVLDKNDKICGMLSRLDFERIFGHFRVFQTGSGFDIQDNVVATLSAQDIMSDKVAYIGPEDPVEEASRIFLENLMHALPVVENGKLLGIITTFDILKYCTQHRNLLIGRQST